MVRVRIIKNSKEYKSGEIEEVTPNIAHGLIEAGVAILSKDVQDFEIKTKSQHKPYVKRRKRNG